MKALDLLKRSLDLKKRTIYSNGYITNQSFKNAVDRAIAEHEQAIKELEDLIAKDKQKNCEECYDKADKALRAIESHSLCDGCIHEPKQGENYYDPCGECKRFYGDCYKDGR